MSKPQNKFLPMVLSLTLITIVTSGLLAVVNELTMEPIKAAKQQRVQNSLQEILPAFDTVKDTVIGGNDVTIAYKDGDIAGYAITSSSNGYGGAFKIMVGYDATGKINDYAILEQQETPGLGAKMVTWFKESVPGRSCLDNLVVSKDGGDVDAITAATITSRAFLKAVNKANNQALVILSGSEESNNPSVRHSER